MNDPVELPPDVKRMIAETSTVEVFDDARKAKLWARLVGRLGPAAASASIGAPILGLPAAGIGGVGIVVIAAICGALALDDRTDGLQRRLPPAAQAPERNAEPTAVPVASQDAAADNGLPSSSENRRVARAPKRVRPREPYTEARRTIPLEEERKIIERARSALARDDLSAADAALREHARRYPAGSLLEDREALAVLVLHEHHSPRAEAANRAFREKFPESVYRAVLDRAFGTPLAHTGE